jgi:hypothetical protein
VQQQTWQADVVEEPCSNMIPQQLFRSKENMNGWLISWGELPLMEEQW